MHSPCQMEWYKNDVNDKSFHVPGGLQRSKSLEGYIIPLLVKDGLARLEIRPYTDAEFDTLPHVFLTSELDWDPTVLDHNIPQDGQWEEDVENIDSTISQNFDEFGDYRHRVTVNHHAYYTRHHDDSNEDIIDQCVASAHNISHNLLSCSSIETSHNLSNEDIHNQLNKPFVINKKDPDWTQLCSLFAW